MRFLLVLLVLICAGPPPAAALRLPAGDRQLVAEIEGYLNGITTLKSDFVQATSAGGYAEGTLYLWRPGRLRFEYDAAPFLLVADGTWLIYHDTELEQISYLPLGSTPAAILVDDGLSLTGDAVKVTGLQRGKGLIALSLVQTAHPEAGEVTLILNETPLELRQWEIVDAQGTRTVVTLNRPQVGVALDEDLFEFHDPRRKGLPGDRRD